MLPIVCLALSVLLLPAARHPPIVVSAAISLADALREVERAYAAAGGGPLRFSFAGSNVLARQIVNGAPADLFISADAAQMDYAQHHGAVDPTSRVHLLRNRLAVVTPRGQAGSIPDAEALRRARRIAVGDPAAVPAGVYAKQYLERIGLWSAIQDRLLPLANVRGALAAAASGGADAAIVYETDVLSAPVDLAFLVTGPDAPEILYPAAIVSRTRHREAAQRFLAFLQGPEARAIFRRYRFS